MNVKSLAKTILSRLPENSRAVVRSSYRSIRNSLSMVSFSIYDARRYHAAAGCFRPRDKGPLEAMLIMCCHTIEKGLSLPDPRPGFGSELVSTLLDETSDYLKLHGSDFTTRMVQNVLNEYWEFNKVNNHDLPALRDRLDELEKEHAPSSFHDKGGSRRVTREEILEGASIDFAVFLNSRHSIRNFSDKPVAIETIEKAVRMAQTTPSVCNRQSGCVFVVEDSEKMGRILSYQNGNRGFNHQIDKLLIVTSRMDTFLSAEERNQQWIDGGMFGMTLVFSLHSLGIGSCCLNWEVNQGMDRKLRKESRIPDEHAIVMLMAIGNLPEEMTVAQSPRRALEEVFHRIGPDARSPDTAQVSSVPSRYGR